MASKSNLYIHTHTHTHNDQKNVLFLCINLFFFFYPKKIYILGTFDVFIGNTKKYQLSYITFCINLFLNLNMIFFFFLILLLYSNPLRKNHGSDFSHNFPSQKHQKSLKIFVSKGRDSCQKKVLGRENSGKGF